MRPLVIVGLLLLPLTVPAQTTNNQLWAEYMLNYPFANSWNVEVAGTYSTLLEEPRWESFDLQITPEYSLTQNFDFTGAVLFNRTRQYQALSSSEFRWMLGTRIHLTPNRRILTRLFLRYEHRSMYYSETDSRQESQRARLRVESLTPLNRKSMFEDKLAYLVADVEFFYDIDKQVSERFANRYRLRFGPGYRLSYTWRFEFLYTLQQSRNTITGGYESTDNLFRIRVKHYLNRSKPSKATGTGN